MASRVLHLGVGMWRRGAHTLRLAQDTAMTIDGEAFKAPAGRVVVRHAKQSLKFLTSKKKYWNAKD